MGSREVETDWFSSLVLEWNSVAVAMCFEDSQSQGRRGKAADFFQAVSDPRRKDFGLPQPSPCWV